MAPKRKRVLTEEQICQPSIRYASRQSAIIPDDMPAIPDNVPAIHPADRAAIIPADMPAVIPAIVRSEAQLLSQEQPLAVDDYVIAVYGKRWYVARVTELSLENDEVALTFMTPKRAKWKWGQRDEGEVERTCAFESKRSTERS